MIVAVLGLWLADAAYIFANQVRIPASLQQLQAAAPQEQAAVLTSAFRALRATRATRVSRLMTGDLR